MDEDDFGDSPLDNLLLAVNVPVPGPPGTPGTPGATGAAGANGTAAPSAFMPAIRVAAFRLTPLSL